MRLVVMSLIAAISLATGAWAAPNVVLPPPVQVVPFPKDAALRSLRLTKAVTALTDGQPWATSGIMLCNSFYDTLKWDGGGSELDVDKFSAAFASEAIKAGFRDASENLFDVDVGSPGTELEFAL